MRITNILFYVFLGLTVILLAIHVRKIIYFENPSKELTEEIYSGQVIISTQLTRYDDQFLLNISFHHIKTEIVVKSFEVQLAQLDKAGSKKLILDKVLPYNSMHNWDIPEFDSFSKIPDSLKILNSSNNPYFTYDYFFKDDGSGSSDMFIATVSANFSENDVGKSFNKDITIIRKSKLDIRPLDAHSDGSFLLIPVTGLLTLVLLLIKILAIVKRKLKAT